MARGISDLRTRPTGKKSSLLRQSFSKTMRNRRKIAHGTPKPHEDEYSYEAIEEDIDENEPGLDSTFSAISEAFSFLNPSLVQSKTWPWQLQNAS